MGEDYWIYDSLDSHFSNCHIILYFKKTPTHWWDSIYFVIYHIYTVFQHISGHNCIFTYDNIEIGENVYIGTNACFQSTHGKIVIGNKVMIGPNVHIHGGNHKVSEIGKYMIDVHDKAKNEDGVVKICDDVWIGACSIILKGVTIGEGSIIGAGSIITKDVAPYSIIVGSLERKEFSRFSSEEIKRHKELLAGMKTDE